MLFNDAAQPWQIGMQDVASIAAEGISNMHDILFFYILIVAITVGWLLFSVLYSCSPLIIKTHSSLIEIIWTITPAFILFFIALPSFKLLYLIDEVVEPLITIKAIGHQWYWSYEYTDYEDKEFDSYMVPEDELELGQLRLLEVDNRVVLPVNVPIRVLVSAADVIHSWAVPALGVKLDGIPGRINQLGLFIKREGVFYGQCSELCGVSHGMMPIVVESVSMEKYLEWLKG